jgi:hypothetical protein
MEKRNMVVAPKTVRIRIAIISLLFLTSLAFTVQAEKIQVEGQACYTFGDNESLVEAKQFCFDLAKRNAIERYCTFVRSETLTKNYQLEKDVVDTLAAGSLENIKIIEETKKNREICYRITGVVDEASVKKYLEQRIATPQPPQPQVLPATPQRTSTSAKFHASRKSNKYHYPWCKWAKRIKPYNLIIFNSVEKAKRAGYIPCKVCRPPL